MEFILILLIIQGLVFGFFCSFIAKEKNRSGGNWFVLGFFFSILAIFALIAIPKIDKENSLDEEKSPSNFVQSFNHSSQQDNRNERSEFNENQAIKIQKERVLKERLYLAKVQLDELKNEIKNK